MDESLQTALLVIFCGFIFGGVGVWILLKHKKLVKICTATVAGVVESVTKRVSTSQDSDGDKTTSVTYAPTFKYIVDGTEYINTSNASSSHLKLKTGDNVTVFYNPANPAQYYVKEHKTGNILGVIFTIVGLAVVVFGIYLAVTGGA